MYRDLVIIRQIPVLREDMGTGRDYIAAGYDSTLHSHVYIMLQPLSPCKLQDQILCCLLTKIVYSYYSLFSLEQMSTARIVALDTAKLMIGIIQNACYSAITCTQGTHT